MVERTRGLDIACHALLILGGLLVCVPIYFAFVVGSHTGGDVLAVPPPWLPGDQLPRERRDGLAEGQSRPAVREFLHRRDRHHGRQDRGVAALGLRHHLFPLPLAA